jgi:acyl-CoA synthetase
VKPLAQIVAANAAQSPDGLAFLEAERRLSWRDYHARSDRLAGVLAGLDLGPGARVAVWLPDGPGVHVVWLACEKTGLVVVGIGPRAGLAELRHLLEKTGATALVSRARHRDVDVCRVFAELRGAGLPLRHHVVIEADVEPDEPVFEGARPAAREARALGPEDLFLLNSTSGTTGLPKCVTQHQARWFHFHELAVEAADLDERDVFMSLLPAPFGFGLWTAHFTPALLGAPTLLMERFDADRALAAIEEHRVSVLAAVSTQFILLLNSPEIARRDLSSLRVLFTGGEAVPTERAVEFEDRTGAAVLQFYGSNETGALSRTTLRDSREVRLGSAGRVIESMQVRLFDDDGADVTATGRGQPGCRGVLTCRGYYEDAAANAKLVREDGWMLTGDVATLEDGVLRVIGRTADFIIRGGKNISGPAVEAAVSTHPAVALAAAVAMPDPVFGERVCVYAELRVDTTLTLEELVAHLSAAGVSKEWFPERLEIVDALPRASGGKVAKQALREDVCRQLGEDVRRRLA